MHLEAEQLRALATLAEELNFTRAAQRLGVAQPALSAQISRMERRLGPPAGGAQHPIGGLTPAGQDLVARARRFLAEADATAAGPAAEATQFNRGSSG